MPGNRKSASASSVIIILIFFRFAVRPSTSLNPGPFYVAEGSNATLPECQVTGYPAPLVTWSKSFDQLLPERVHSNKSVMKLFGVRKVDSDNYLCTATNLLRTVVKRTVLVVVSLPKFNVRPPEKVTALIGETFTLVVNWKKQGAQLPVGRSQEINGVLFIRNTKKEDAGNYICAATNAGFFLPWKLSQLLCFCFPKVIKDFFYY